MERRLAAAMKRAEVEFGLPNSIEAMLPGPVAAERNAAAPLDEAAGIVRPYFRNFGFAPSRDLVGFCLQADPSLGRRLLIEEVNRLLDEVDHRKEFAPIDPIRRPWVLQPTSAPHRPRLLLLESEAIVGRQLASDGKPNEAARRLLRVLRINRKWTAGEPWFGDFAGDVNRRGVVIEELNRILRTGRIESALYDAIDREMEEQDRCQELFVRQYYIEMLKRLDDFEINPNRRQAWWLIGPLAANDRLLIVEWYARIMRCIPRPYAEVKDELEAADAELRAISNHRLGRFLHPDAMGVTSKSYRGDWLQAEARCLRIINAMAKSGRWEAELDTLGLPNEALVDPVNRQRLHVKKTPTGPIVYSVGLDRKDNGGTLEGNTIDGLDIGLGPVSAKGTKQTAK